MKKSEAIQVATEKQIGLDVQNKMTQ